MVKTLGKAKTKNKMMSTVRKYLDSSTFFDAMSVKTNVAKSEHENFFHTWFED